MITVKIKPGREAKHSMSYTSHKSTLQLYISMCVVRLTTIPAIKSWNLS